MSSQAASATGSKVIVQQQQSQTSTSLQPQSTAVFGGQNNTGSHPQHPQQPPDSASIKTVSGSGTMGRVGTVGVNHASSGNVPPILSGTSVAANSSTPQSRQQAPASSQINLQQPSQQQQNQKKQLLKSYQVMMQSTKNHHASTTNKIVQQSSQQQQTSSQPASSINNGSSLNTSLLQHQNSQRPGNNSTNLMLQQKRISGSQQQIQAAIASKLHSQKLRKQAAAALQQHHQSSTSGMNTSHPGAGLVQQFSHHNNTANNLNTGMNMQQYLASSNTNNNTSHQSNTNSANNPTTTTTTVVKNLKIAQGMAQGTTNKRTASRSGKEQMLQQQQVHKKSLNTELAALCAADQSVSYAGKAKSGGVRANNRNDNIVMNLVSGGLVGTPSATQRVTTVGIGATSGQPSTTNAAAVAAQKKAQTSNSALSNKKPQYVGKYQLQEIVGRGAFGRVYKGLNTATNEIVAIKMIPLYRLKTDFKKSIIDEIDLMKKLDHRNIVKYIETVQSGHQLCIVLEFIEGGSLEYLYKKFGCFSETLVAIYIKQVLKGLEYLHRQTVIHRDIKGGNILTTKDGVVKLADFGVATKLTDAEKNNSFAGTPHWMAPEVIEMSGNLTSASDIWSVGCTVYELLKGSPPNYDLNKFCAMIRNVREPMPIPDVVSPELRDFLQKCFTKDPSKRPSAAELIEHSWFKHLEKNKLARLLQKQSLPQEVTNTIKVHLDSQQQDEHNSTSDNSKATAAQETAKATTTQQKVKNVAKILTRQNVSMQPQSQPILSIKGQTASGGATTHLQTATERQLKIQQPTSSAQIEHQNNNSQSKQQQQHPIIYSQAKNTSGVQTTVTLKKAIQDKLSAAQAKMTTTSQSQKAKSSLATKNHMSQMAAMMNQGIGGQTQTSQQDGVVMANSNGNNNLNTTSATNNVVNRANSASQRNKMVLTANHHQTSAIGTDVVVNAPGGNTAIVVNKQQQQLVFHPASTTNAATSLNLIAATASSSSANDIAGAIKHQSQQQISAQTPSAAQGPPNLAVVQNRAQTSLGVSKSSGTHGAHNNHQQQVIGVLGGGNSFIDNGISAPNPNQLCSGPSHPQTTTAAQQRQSQGALFDLRGNSGSANHSNNGMIVGGGANKRLFHLSKKMIGSNTASIPISTSSNINKSQKQTSAATATAEEAVIATQHLQNDAPSNNTCTTTVNNVAVIPASQLITEYSPEQLHLRDVEDDHYGDCDENQLYHPTRRLQAPHTSAAQEHRLINDNKQQKQQNQQSKKSRLKNTAEKHTNQQQFVVSSLAPVQNGQATGVGVGQIIQLKGIQSTTIGQRNQMLKHSLTEEDNLVGSGHPNFFKQWTEQTELTENVIHGGQLQNRQKSSFQGQQHQNHNLPFKQQLNVDQQQHSPVEDRRQYFDFYQHQGDDCEDDQDSSSQQMHHLAHNEEEHDSAEEDSPAHKLANQPELPRKPNWPIKIYQHGGELPIPHHQQVPQKALIIASNGTKNASALQQSTPFGANTSNLNKSAEIMQQNAAASGKYQTMQQQQQQQQMMMMGLDENNEGPSAVTENSSSQQLLAQNSRNQSHTTTGQVMTTDAQQQRTMYSEEKNRIMIDATRRNAMSSLSQNYPSANVHSGNIKKPGVSNIITSATTGHTNMVHSLTATGHYQYPQSTMNNAHAQHKSLGAPGSGVMHTAKASQKQTRLRSPLAAQVPLGSSNTNNNTATNEYQHHTTMDAMGQGIIMAPGTTSGMMERDESDLGDLDGDDDTSNALFQQYVTRTNLGLNRKPSNTTSLSGTTTLVPQKKGIGGIAATTSNHNSNHNNNYAVVSTTTRDRKGQLSRDGYPQFLPSGAAANGSGNIINSKYQQPQEVKQQIKKANEAGFKQAVLIKRKMFLLETVISGDTHLMQVIVANSTHSCCSSSGGDEEDENGLADDSDDDDVDENGLEAAKFRHHQCERVQFQKSPNELSNELCALIKAVINGDVWPLHQNNNSATEHQQLISGMDDLILNQFAPLISDAFKDAFLSQLSFTDIIELLLDIQQNSSTAFDESNADSQPATESVAYTALQLINQLAEGSVTIQRQFFAAGLVQKLQEFTAINSSTRREIKVEVAYFIGQVFTHSKELIGIYMGCQGYKIQLDFIQLCRQDHFSDNLYLIMIAIDSILVMFEECPSINNHHNRANNQLSLSHSQNSQSIAAAGQSKRYSQHGSASVMSDRDLAKILTKAGLMEPLARQIPNFLQLAEQTNFLNSQPESKEGQNALMYLERIFDIFNNLAICGQHTVRQHLCSQRVMGESLTQIVHALATSQNSSPIKYQISKWYVKLIIALTSSQQQLAPQSASSQIVIFELLGQSEVVTVLSRLVPLYVQHHQSMGGATNDTTNYLASLYETLKLLNLLAKTSPARCEQACHAGQIVLQIHSLISYLEGIGQATNPGGAVISRSKKCRLINASLQLLHELVVACLSTRTALLEHEIPALLLQLFHLKASSQSQSIMSAQQHHSQNKSHGTHSLSLQSANNNIRSMMGAGGGGAATPSLMTSASGNLLNNNHNPQAAAQDQETISRILDIFVLWVQQDDQTGQIMQEIVANQQSLEVIFSLIYQPRRQKSTALFAFFNALTRILLASDCVIEALLQHVHLIVHLSAILVFLSEHLGTGSGNPTSILMQHQQIDTANSANTQHHHLNHQGGQTGATPLSRRGQASSNVRAASTSTTALVEHQGLLASQWRDEFQQQNSASTNHPAANAPYHQHHHHGGSHEHLQQYQHQNNSNKHFQQSSSRLRSQDRTTSRGGMGINTAMTTTSGGLMMAAVANMESANNSTIMLGMQQTTQILKELLEIFQLLVQYQHQISQTGTPPNNFIVQLDLRRTIEQVLSIAAGANLVILQSMASQLLQQINEHLAHIGYTSMDRQQSQGGRQPATRQQQFYEDDDDDDDDDDGLDETEEDDEQNDDYQEEDESVTEQEQFSSAGGRRGVRVGRVGGGGNNEHNSASASGGGFNPRRIAVGRRPMTPNSVNPMTLHPSHQTHMFQHHQVMLQQQQQHQQNQQLHQQQASSSTTAILKHPQMMMFAAPQQPPSTNNMLHYQKQQQQQHHMQR